MRFTLRHKKVGEKRTNSVGSSGSLQFGQFCGIHDSFLGVVLVQIQLSCRLRRSTTKRRSVYRGMGEGKLAERFVTVEVDR